MSKGKIIKVVGPVVDVEFPAGQLPAIYNALKIQTKDQVDQSFKVDLTILSDVLLCPLPMVWSEAW